MVVTACGNDSDSPVADEAATPTPTVTVSVSATPKAGKPKPTTKPSAVATGPAATAAATPKSTKAAPAKPAYRVAMPDGRTSPAESDWKFDHLTLKPGNAFEVTGTVDVTYNGPGLASMFFTVLVTLTNETSQGPWTDTAEYKGSVSAMQAGATETVRLGGANSPLFGDTTTYEGQYTIESMSDDDPKARAD